MKISGIQMKLAHWIVYGAAWMSALSQRAHTTSNSLRSTNESNNIAGLSNSVNRAVYPHGFNSHLHIKTTSLLLLNENRTQGYGILYEINEALQQVTLYSIHQATALSQESLKELHAFITQQQRLFIINQPHIQGSEKSFNRFIKYASTKAMNVTSNNILKTISNPKHVTKQHTLYDKKKNTQRLCEYFNSAARFDHIPFWHQQLSQDKEQTSKQWGCENFDRDMLRLIDQTLHSLHAKTSRKKIK